MKAAASCFDFVFPPAAGLDGEGRQLFSSCFYTEMASHQSTVRTVLRFDPKHAGDCETDTRIKTLRCIDLLLCISIKDFFRSDVSCTL